MIKSVAILCDSSPIGKNSAIEAIRLGSGFMGLGEEIQCTLILTDDAVYLMNKHADPKAVGMDSVDEPIEMADLSDLEIKILASSLRSAGLTEEDLVEYENLAIISSEEMADIIEKADTVFRY